MGRSESHRAMGLAQAVLIPFSRQHSATNGCIQEAKRHRQLSGDELEETSVASRPGAEVGQARVDRLKADAPNQCTGDLRWREPTMLQGWDADFYAHLPRWQWIHYGVVIRSRAHPIRRTENSDALVLGLARRGRSTGPLEFKL